MLDRSGYCLGVSERNTCYYDYRFSLSSHYSIERLFDEKCISKNLRLRGINVHRSLRSTSLVQPLDRLFGTICRILRPAHLRESPETPLTRQRQPSLPFSRSMIHGRKEERSRSIEIRAQVAAGNTAVSQGRSASGSPASEGGREQRARAHIPHNECGSEIRQADAAA